MKYFADDYYKDGRQKGMKAMWKSSNRYEIVHIYPNFSWHPSWDLYESEEFLIVLVEMSGIQIDDVEVNVERERLDLRANRWRPSEREMICIHRMEIDFGLYHHTIALPEPVDPNCAILTYRDGFLLIRLPKEVKNVNSDTR